MFNLRLNFYCYHKQIRTLTFAGFIITKQSTIENRQGLKKIGITIVIKSY